MGSKIAPGAFDCYANAEPDEPMFVLLARDPDAPNVVRDWAAARSLRDGPRDPKVPGGTGVRRVDGALGHEEPARDPHPAPRAPGRRLPGRLPRRAVGLRGPRPLARPAGCRVRRLVVFFATLGACASPPAATVGRAPDPPRVAPEPSTTTSAPAPEGVGARATTPPVTAVPASSGPTMPPTTMAPDSGPRGTTRASWYGDESGSHTANGERYDPAGLTFAHRTMPFGTRVRFCRGGACVVARCSDRGPASWTGRDFDLSRAAFAAISPLSAGVATVTWERVG